MSFFFTACGASHGLCQSDCVQDSCSGANDDDEHNLQTLPQYPVVQLPKDAHVAVVHEPKTVQEQRFCCQSGCIKDPPCGGDAGLRIAQSMSEGEVDEVPGLFYDAQLTPRIVKDSGLARLSDSRVSDCTLEPCNEEQDSEEELSVEVPAKNVTQAPSSIPQFSLPWSDLSGNHQASTMTSEGELNKQSSREALLPFSQGSTGSCFNILYRPKFVTGLPSQAYLYKPTITDDIDCEVCHVLQGLSREASTLLELRRVEAGKYEIEGRSVFIYRGANGLFVHEDEVGPGIDDMPLHAYIPLAANVALDLQRIASVESFIHAATPTHDIVDVERYRAMQLACMQATIRK